MKLIDIYDPSVLNGEFWNGEKSESSKEFVDYTFYDVFNLEQLDTVKGIVGEKILNELD